MSQISSGGWRAASAVVAVAIIASALAVARPAAAAPAANQAGITSCPSAEATWQRKLKAEKEYVKLDPTDVLHKAYLNIQLAQVHVELLARQECLAEKATEAVTAKVLEDYEASFSKQAPQPPSPEAARQAIDNAAMLERTSAQLALAKSAHKFLREQFLRLKLKVDEARQAGPAAAASLDDEVKALSKLVPTYPTPVTLDDIKKADVYLAASGSAGTATKANELAKNARRYADEAKAAVLTATLALADGTVTPADRVEAARRALSAAESAADAERLAKDAQSASQVAGALTLRAQSRTTESLEKQDLASVRAMMVQLESDKQRVEYARTESLLNKLNIKATVEQKISVAKEREDYIELMTVVANNPDAQAIIGSPGIKLTAESGESNATLKLSLDRLFGGTQRTFDLTLTAPATKNRTSLANTLDGLSGGFSAQLTATSYSLLELRKDKHYFGLLGVGGRIGRQTLTYVDESDLSAPRDVTRKPASVLAYAGLAPVSMKWLTLAKFEYQKAYKEGDAVTECPAALSGPVRCLTGPLGLPSLVHKRIWSLEFRKAWDAVAVGALVSRDTIARKTRVDVPVYFLTGPEKDGATPALTGGINFSWDADKHGSIGLFIGSPFEVKNF